MSQTVLVRSTSSSNSLIVQKPATPATTSPVVLPKLNLTPKQSTSAVAKPSTPQQQKPQTPRQQPPSSAPSTPGHWQHPRMGEIIRRQSASTFDKSNVHAMGLSTLLMVISFYAPTVVPGALVQPIRPYDSYALWTIRVLLSINIFFLLRPLWRNPDPCYDIPLTPAQRQRLGLPPMTRPATPAEKEQYVTPPRYSRSTTPRTDSGSGGMSIRAQNGGSPMSGRGTPMSPFGSPAGARRASGSQMGTPSGLGSSGRRASYNASPLGVSDFDAGGISGTPTKVVGNPRASVGLNSKWLYEKGRASPQSAAGGNGSFTTGAWGTGSVFT